MSRPIVDTEFLGTIFKDKILSRNASISENSTTAFYFQVIDEDGFFAEITINNLRDDLDLTLFDWVNPPQILPNQGIQERKKNI